MYGQREVEVTCVFIYVCTCIYLYACVFLSVYMCAFCVCMNVCVCMYVLGKYLKEFVKVYLTKTVILLLSQRRVGDAGTKDAIT